MVSNPVLKTLIYESIFNFPMTLDEVWKFLISDKKISRKKFEQYLRDPRINFDTKTKLYGLTSDNSLFQNRIIRKKISEKKEVGANRAVKLLSEVPTIEFIGISGSLAQMSASEPDDIDLFIIVKKNTVWMTRFVCVIILKAFGMYRREGDHKDKICLNMITDGYAFPLERQDLYNAFEIAQLRPKMSRDNTYESFVLSNAWIIKFLPNFEHYSSKRFARSIRQREILVKFFDFLIFLQFEKIIKRVQLAYMKKRTNETIGDHILAFHPRDFRSEILKKYNSKLATTRGH